MYSLLSNLALRYKFMILGFLALLITIIPTVLFTQSINDSLDNRVARLQGLAPERAIVTAIGLTQKHRGMCARLLNGDASARAPCQALRDQADQAYARTAELIATQSDNDNATETWQSITQEWQDVKALFGSDLPEASRSFEVHTALIRNMLEAARYLLDDFRLSLTSQPDVYQLVQSLFVEMPALTEALGQLRGRGAGQLARGEASVAERSIMEALRIQALGNHRVLEHGLESVMLYHPEMEAALQEPLKTATTQLMQGLSLVKDVILQAQSLEAAPQDYFNTLTSTIEAQLALSDVAVSQLQDQLQHQISDLQQQKWGLLGVLGAGLLLALGLGTIVARAIVRPIHDAVDMARRVADGDLTGRLTVRGRDECAHLARALNEMGEGLTRIVSEVRNGSETIATAAGQIASANMDMSQRTEEQAASLEQTSASTQQIHTTAGRNAEHTREAGDMALSASRTAKESGDLIHGVVATMQAIHQDSDRMSEIISMIDSIAFRTNLLALNASIEAARAGEHGRGFAVVASEVRGLAQRSASAADDIRSLIETSGERVRDGVTQVDQAGSAMQTLQDGIERVAAITDEIRVGSDEQSTGIDQIHQAISQMDDVTQRNAAMVEQTSAAATSLEEQTEILRRLMASFRLQATS
ncbi:methyl-accepting chemotaxis protein [Kushneria phyllosphaerae]|uniref:Methyl-accepting chemotaxis protein III n=1 Tax=Kushneria phyllosphaerae TaxID=2100822 RepID=A0A2R8CJ81_9GAMM|nr:methyl-accepting chemotaxis protein [Kushneria phyllosphaerae]SPJ32968.1 Methyl-accepting chemotaxis protein III [Kushneria phyllosphaerae]